MSATFFLHVGLQRCASTLIEHAFLDPQHHVSQQLRQAGVEPLLDLHLYLRDHRGDAFWTDAFVADLRANHMPPANGNVGGYFLTEEGLSATWLESGPGIDVAGRAHCLAALLVGFDARILMLVRDQASFVRSLYALHLQNGGQLGFAEFVKGIPQSALDWHSLVGYFVDAFGAGAVQVVPYNAECFQAQTSPYPGFVSALQGLMGVAEPTEVPRNHLYNPSIKTPFLPMQLSANRTVPSEIAGAVSDLLRSGVTEPVAIMRDIRGRWGREAAAELRQAFNTGMVAQAANDAAGFDDTAATAFLARYADSNRAMFAAFMPDYDPAPFLAA